MYNKSKKSFFEGRLLLYSLVFVFSLLLVSDLWAEYVHVTNIKIENNEKFVLVSYKISGAFNELLNQRIESGLPAEFVFRLKVIMNRPPWLEKKLIEKEIVNKVTYDNITEKYTVNVETDGEKKEYVFTELSKMQEKMTYIKDFPIIEIDKLTPHREYFLKIRGELTEKKVMLFPLDFLLSFLSTDFSTGWKISDTFSLDKIKQLKKTFIKKKD